MNWPVYGDRGVFQRTMLICAVLGVSLILASAAIAIVLLPKLLATMAPLTVALVLLQLLWAHSHAQAAGRRVEIVNSFAGLTVLHHGHAIRINEDSPLVGEYDTRRRAARAAMDVGHWAVIVRAYDRYYVLGGRPTDNTRTPVAFRTRAVADIVPALANEPISA